MTWDDIELSEMLDRLSASCSAQTEAVAHWFATCIPCETKRTLLMGEQPVFEHQLNPFGPP